MSIGISLENRDGVTAEDVNRLTKKLHANGLIHSCLTCAHFNEAKETCDLTLGQRPPARVIAYGCPEWLDNIPF